MKKYIVDVDVRGTEKVEKLNQSLEQTAKNTGLADTKIGKMGMEFVDFGKKAISSFRSLGTASDGTFSKIRLGIASTGIGLLLLAITAVVKYFTKGEEGSNKLKVAMAALGQVVSVVVDSVMALGKFLGKIGSIIGGVVSGSTSLGEAWVKTKEAAKGLANEVTNLSKSIQNAIDLEKRAQQLAIDKRENLVKEAKLSVELARAKEQIDNQELSAQKRIELLNKASDLQNQISDEKIRLAKEEFEIQKGLNGLSLTSAEEKEKQLQLEADVILLEAERADRQKEFTAKRSALLKSETDKKAAEIKAQADLDQKALDEKAAALQKEYELAEAFINKELDLNRKFRDALRSLEQENYLSSISDDFERQAAKIQQDEDNFNADLQRKLLNEEITQEELLKLREQGEIKFAYQREKAIQDDIDKNKEKNKTKQEDEKVTAQVGLQIAGAAFGALADLSEGDFEKQKKFRIAQAVISTISGAIDAYNSAAKFGPAAPFIGAALAAIVVASGYANIKRIQASTPSSAGSAGGGPSSGGNASTSNQQNSAPSLSLVSPLGLGQVSKTSQANQPLKTYVIGSDVTTQQALDRKIESQAKI